MSLTIVSDPFAFNDRRTNLELLITSDGSWVDVSNVLHGAGDDSNIFVQRVAGLTNDTTAHQLTIPEFDLASTIDAIRGSTVRLYFTIVAVNGQSMNVIASVPGTENGLMIPDSIVSMSPGLPDGSCTFADLIVYNTPAPSPTRDTYPTLAEVQALIRANIGIDSPIAEEDDLIVGGPDGVPARFPAGLAGYFIGYHPSTGHLGAFPVSSGFSNPMTTAADMIVAAADGAPARLAKGAEGTLLSIFNGVQRYINPGVVYAEPYINSGVYVSPQAAVAATIAALGVKGGTVILPADEIDFTGLLVVGNGLGDYSTGAATYSTINGVTLQGAGGGSGANSSLGYTTIRYTGPSTSGAVISASGPMFKLSVKDVAIDCNALAAIGLDLNHVQEGWFESVKVLNNTGYGFRLRGYSNPTGGGNGANNNMFVNCFVISLQNSAGGLDLGHTDTGASPRLDAAQNTFLNCRFRFDGAPGTTTGIRLNFTDASTFINCLTAATNSVNVRPPTGSNGAAYPQAIVFYNCPLQGTLTTSGSVPWAGTDGLTFYAYPVDDGEAIPPETPAGLYKGVTTTGVWFGQFINLPLLFAARSASVEVSNTSVATKLTLPSAVTIPADKLSYLGTRVRLRASGHYSSTGTPTLTLEFRIGSDAVANAALTCGTGVSDYPWSAETDFFLPFVGVGGILQRGFGYLALLSGGASPNALRGVINPFNTTIDKEVTTWATFSAADPANKVTLDTLTVEVDRPRVAT